MTKFKLTLVSLFTGLLLSLNAHAALINLSFTGTTNAGSAMEALFVVDSNDVTSFFGAATPLNSAQFSQLSGSPIVINTNNSRSYFGSDSDLRYRATAVDSLSILDITFPFVGISYKPATNNATIDISGTISGGSFTGTNFAIDLLTLDPNGFSGFINSGSLNTKFTVDTLNVSVTGISAVPVPAAAWLFASGLIGLFGFARKKTA